MTQCIQTKRCSRCHEKKPVEDFHRQHKDSEARGAYCKPCALAAKRDHYSRTKETRVHDYEKSIRLRYGMSAEEYAMLCEAQDHRCLICGCDPHTEYAHLHEKAQRLNVEHCHESGRFRGLVCQRCNKHLAFAGDRPEILRRLLAYMEGELVPLRT